MMSFKVNCITLCALFALFAVVLAADNPTSATTAAASTTTIAPTTTADPTTKNDTTTVAPTVPTTQPSPPPTTEPPAPPQVPDFPVAATFQLNNTINNHTCLTVQMALQFDVNGTLVNVTEHANVTSFCPNDTNAHLIELRLSFDKENVSLIFERDEKNTTWLANVTLTHHDGKEYTNYTFHDALFQAEGKKSYKCKSETSIVATNATEVKARFRDVHVMHPFALDVTEIEPLVNGDVVCAMDDDMNDVIPIAVGAALIALVAIVLIAYCVGRRRSRRLAYQSV